MKKIGVTVSITRTRDGKTVEYADELYQNFDGESHYDGTFIWEDGNYSCDCNRHLFFQAALGLDDDDIPCSSGKYRVNWIKDVAGKVWYKERAAA